MERLEKIIQSLIAAEANLLRKNKRKHAGFRLHPYRLSAKPDDIKQSIYQEFINLHKSYDPEYVKRLAIAYLESQIKLTDGLNPTFQQLLDKINKSEYNFDFQPE